MCVRACVPISILNVFSVPCIFHAVPSSSSSFCVCSRSFCVKSHFAHHRIYSLIHLITRILCVHEYQRIFFFQAIINQYKQTKDFFSRWSRVYDAEWNSQWPNVPNRRCWIMTWHNKWTTTNNFDCLLRRLSKIFKPKLIWGRKKNDKDSFVFLCVLLMI